MNNILLLFLFYLFVKSSHANQIKKAKHKPNLIIVPDVNITKTFRDRKPDRIHRDVGDDISLPPTYSHWSSWSRCEDCLQMRMKKCISPACEDSRMYEEKPCRKKRCVRKRNRKRQREMHVVRVIEKQNIETRTMQSKIWSKWSRWSECSEKCRSQRYRMCKKPGRCKKKREQQTAYCYHEKSNCEKYVLHLLDNSRPLDTSRYQYNRQNHHNSWKRKCGRPLRKPKMLKIIGGTESKKHKWPWHVALLNLYMEVFCAGTLIHPRWVLTAGHCLRKYLRVRFNEHDLTTVEGREEEMTVQRMFLHPRFDHITVDNDIALLRLPRPVRLPVACLPSSEPVTKDLCYIMGWGKEKADSVYGTNKLHEARIPVVNTNLCRRAYRRYIITHNMFCAGWKSGVADTCAGDSGGGLMCPTNKSLISTAYAVQGITSFGDGCGRKNKYGIYTQVNNYLKWIQSTIEKYS